jgi:hypothetical protein
MATNTQSAFVPIASVAPEGSSSISGTDNLLSWVSGAQLAAKPKPQTPVIIQNNTTTTTVVPTPVPPASSSLTFPLVTNGGAVDVYSEDYTLYGF